MKAEDFLARFLNKKLSKGDKESERLAKKIAKSQSLRAITEGPEITMDTKITMDKEITMDRRATYVE